MKQVLRKGLKQIIVDEVPDPVVAPHHVLVRPLYSLISSGTETASIHQQGVLKEVADNPSHLRKIWDVMKATGPARTAAEVRAKFSEYAVLGYSGAGVVVDKHATVTDLEVGDRVAYGGEGTGHGETILAARNLVARVPDSVPFEHACFTTLGSIALNAVRTAQVGIGDVVAVIGLGLVGQLIAQLVRLQGGVCVAIDLKQDRVELAERSGADYGVIGSASMAEQVRAITYGRGVDCAIVAAASKSSAPCRQALQICKDRGRMVIVGAVEMSFPWDEMYMKEIQLFMSRAYGPGSYDDEYEKRGRDYPISYVRWTENRNLEEFLRLAATGRVDLQPLITHEFDLEEAASAYKAILDPSSNSLAVLLRYPAADGAGKAPGAGFKPLRRVATAARAVEKDELRVALVGAGNLARWEHLPNLNKIRGARLQAVYSASGARGKNYADRFGAAYCSTDFEEVLSDPEIDLVMILSRNQHHAAQSIAALRAGKHVFVEKPMAITEDECRAVCRAVEETGRQLTVGFNRRFAPFYAEQKKILARRAGPAVINCRMSSPGMSSAYWMSDPAIGGGVLGEACHFVDLMCWLLDSEPAGVSAYCLPTGRREPIGENNIVASFRFEDGSVGNLTYCTVGGKAGGESVEAFAQGVSVAVEDFKRLRIQDRLRRSKSKLWADKGYASQLESFIGGIRKGETPGVTARDGARATVACLRMLESARTLGPRAIDLYEVLG
ncbi:MAG TPA: bi-domain-containing oxidoreductase [Blastocatellia bacterium]|jgi:predicted dehydrogenase|nr:bi-domain-containing oxidoreductase [Blastocatellia bacterium]